MQLQWFAHSNDYRREKDYIEKSLLQRVGKDKTLLVYQDILVWLYMHRNDFDGAIIQAKSLDMQRNGDGSSVMRIANAQCNKKTIMQKNKRISICN